MMCVDLSIKIGGEAGQGLQSIGYILARSLARGGLHVFANQDYMSRIRGGHNFFQVRVSDKPVWALSESIHLLIALDGETVMKHGGELVEGGAILFDGEKITRQRSRGRMVSIPFERVAREKTGRGIMANSVAVGAALSLLNYDFALLESVLTRVFGRKGSEVAEKNVEAARAGYEYVDGNLRKRFPYSVKPMTVAVNRLFMTGNEAIASSALIAGCKIMTGYPMSPATPIQQYFASKMKDYPIVFEQAEDEISAVNMVLGASFAGVRAMTATSGGGFSLMVEGLSLAGMTETPLVIVVAQRPGPATGFPTRTEQGELEFAVHAGHGEFPRVVLAPGTVDQAFHLTWKAFNLAEKYHVPVILLSDQHLSDSYTTVERFDTSQLAIKRGPIYTEADVKKLGGYKRHLVTRSGVSPRLFPGQKLGLVVTDSDEHNEEGHITEEAEDRVRNVKKRMRKLVLLRREMTPPYAEGPLNSEILLLGWGSTFGAIREAVDVMNRRGSPVRMLHLSEVWPFPVEAVAEELERAGRSIMVEGNATGQMAHLIRAETGISVDNMILRYDGRPISPQYILRRLEEEG